MIEGDEYNVDYDVDNALVSQIVVEESLLRVLESDSRNDSVEALALAIKRIEFFKNQ